MESIEPGQVWISKSDRGERIRIAGPVINMEDAWYVRSDESSEIMRATEVRDGFTLLGSTPTNDP